MVLQNIGGLIIQRLQQPSLESYVCPDLSNGKTNFACSSPRNGLSISIRGIAILLQYLILFSNSFRPFQFLDFASSIWLKPSLLVASKHVPDSHKAPCFRRTWKHRNRQSTNESNDICQGQSCTFQWKMAMSSVWDADFKMYFQIVLFIGMNEEKCAISKYPNSITTFALWLVFKLWHLLEIGVKTKHSNHPSQSGRQPLRNENNIFYEVQIKPLPKGAMMHVPG